jgi:hypothetical protein
MSAADNSPDDDTPKFRSPKRCLAHSFRLSRDRWKLKATQRRQQIKTLQIRLRDLQTSRDLWKQKALQLQAQLQELLGVIPPADQDTLALTQTESTSAAPAEQTPARPADAVPTLATEDVPPKKAHRARC